jgi:hypothetical protein
LEVLEYYFFSLARAGMLSGRRCDPANLQQAALLLEELIGGRTRCAFAGSNGIDSDDFFLQQFYALRELLDRKL